MWVSSVTTEGWARLFACVSCAGGWLLSHQPAQQYPPPSVLLASKQNELILLAGQRHWWTNRAANKFSSPWLPVSAPLCSG